MSNPSNRTIATTMLLGPPFGFFGCIGMFVPFKEVPELLHGISAIAFVFGYAVLLFLAMLIAALYTKIAESRGRIPFWAALIPSLGGVLIGLLLNLFIMSDPQGPVHGAFGVVFLPIGLLLPMSVLTWLCVRWFWGGNK
jgi:hypothetical protein